MEPLPLALTVLSALLGSIPFGLILAKSMLGVDLKAMGSGNIGATNAARAGGAGLAADSFSMAFMVLSVHLFFTAGRRRPLVAVIIWRLSSATATRLGVAWREAATIGGYFKLEPKVGVGLPPVRGSALFRTSAIGSLAGTGVCGGGLARFFWVALGSGDIAGDLFLTLGDISHEAALSQNDSGSV